MLRIAVTLLGPISFLALMTLPQASIAASLKIEIVDNIERLEEYKWNNRLVVVLLEKNPSQEIDSIINYYSKEYDGLEERKLIFILIENQTAKSDLLKVYKKRYKKNVNGPYMIIGLDGVIKRTRKELFTPAKLYKFVDSMPMRKSELASK